MGQAESNYSADDALIMDDLDEDLDNVYIAPPKESSSSTFSDLADANEEALENIFKEIDVDDSKSIDLSEFKAFIMKKRPSHPTSQSHVTNPKEKTLEEAKKKGLDPATIAKLQRDVHKQRPSETNTTQRSVETFKVQKRAASAYGSRGKIPTQENANGRNYEVTGRMAKILKKQVLAVEKVKMHTSATIIQKYVRGHFGRNRFRVFLTKKTRELSARKIQKFARRFLWFRFLSLMVHKKIQEESASTLQRWIRRLLWLQFFKKFWLKKAIEKEQNEAARIIQGFGKVLLAKETLRLKRLQVYSASKIQRAVRRRFWFKFLKRMLLKLAEEREKNGATIVIQSIWRMVLAKQTLEDKLFEKKIRDAVIVLQGFRRVILAKHLKKTLMEAKVRHDSAATIQRLVRRYFWLRFFKRFWLKKARERERKHAATRIQSRYRVMLARHEFIPMLIYHRREVAAVYCQKIIRRHLATRKFKAMKEAYRLYVSALRIQKCWKHKRDYSRFRLFLQLKRTTNATIVLQAWVRKRQQMLIYFKIRWAAKKIQWMFREYKWNQLRLLKSEYMLLKSRAISRWHDNSKTTVFDYVRQSAITIQSRYRGVLSRRKFRLLKEEFRAHERLRIAKIKERSIEKVYISRKEHQNYRKMLVQHTVGEDRFREHVDYFLFSECVLIIQSAYRRYIMRKWFRKYCLYYSQHMHEIILFQANIRMHFARQRYLKERQNTLTYVVFIQRKFRIYRFIRSLSHRRLARLKVQTYARFFVAKARYIRIKAAVAVIRRLFKRNLVKFWIRKLKWAVRSLQCYVRAYVARCFYSKLRIKTIKLQSFVRMLCAQVRISKIQAAGVLIQRYCRGYNCRQIYLLKKTLVYRLQQIFRNFRLRQIVCTIQRFVRRKIIFKDCLVKLIRFAYFHKRVDKVILVQKIYRGKRTQRTYNIIRAEKKAYKACYECLRPKLFAEMKSKVEELDFFFTLKRNHRNITLPVLLLEIEHYHALKAEQLKEASEGAFLVEQYRQKCASKIQRSFRLYLDRLSDERAVCVSRRDATRLQAAQSVQSAWRSYRLRCREAQEAKNFVEAIQAKKDANEREKKLKSNRLHILNRIFSVGSAQQLRRSSFI